MVYWIVWAAIGLIFFAIYSAEILPGLFRLAVGTAYRISDRGLEKFNLTNGISVLYGPDAITSEYIKRYQIYRKADYCYAPVFLGEWGKLPKSIEYEISAFDRHNMLLAKKRICKNPLNARYTDAVFLPFDTAYISLCVRRVDGEYISHPRKTSRIFPLLLALFACAAAFALVGFLYVILTCLSEISGNFVAGGLSPSPRLWCALLLLPALLLAGSIMLAGCLSVYRERIGAQSAPLLRKMRVPVGYIGRTMAAMKRCVALHARFLFEKIRCAFGNVCSAVEQCSVFYRLRFAIMRWTLPFRILKRRRRKNG